MGSRARSCFFCSAHDVGSLCVLAGPQPPCLQLWTTLPSPARDTCHRQGCAGRRPARPLDQHCSDFAHQSPRLLREGRVRFGRTAVEPGNLHFRPTPRDADAAGPPLEQGSPCACFWGGAGGGGGGWTRSTTAVSWSLRASSSRSTATPRWPSFVWAPTEAQALLPPSAAPQTPLPPHAVTKEGG